MSGWSTDSTRAGSEIRTARAEFAPDDEEWAEDEEVFDDHDRDKGGRVLVETESPDGRPVLLGVQAGSHPVVRRATTILGSGRAFGHGGGRIGSGRCPLRS